MENNALAVAVATNENQPVTTFPWGQIAAFLTDQGIAEEHLPAAFLTIIVMVSAKLGAPMALVFIEEKDSQAPVGIVEACKKVVPSENYCDLCTLPRRKLLSSGGVLAGKAIICNEASELNQASPDIRKLLESGAFVDHDFEMGREGVNLVTRTVRGDVALIAISSNMKDKILAFPNALKIRLPQASQSQQQAIQNVIRRCSSANQRQISQSATWLTARFKGIEPIDIELEGILGNVATLVGELGNDIETMARLVRIISILNKFSEIPVEIRAGALLYGQSAASLWANCQARQQEGAEVKLLPDNMGEVSTVNNNPAIFESHGLSALVIATKVDYYFFELIMRRWLPTVTRDEALTPRQMRIYKAIEKYNLEYLRTSTGVDMNDPVEIINTITCGWSYGCISVAQLGQDVKQDENDEALSPSTINRELEGLVDLGIIKRLRHPHSPNRFDYAIATLSPGQAVSCLPHPSALRCPKYGREPVQVINPITKQVETI